MKKDKRDEVHAKKEKPSITSLGDSKGKVLLQHSALGSQAVTKICVQ